MLQFWIGVLAGIVLLPLLLVLVAIILLKDLTGDTPRRGTR
mgnify:CR=1 FL=1